jgi:hypothetical protein
MVEEICGRWWWRTSRKASGSVASRRGWVGARRAPCRERRHRATATSLHGAVVPSHDNLLVGKAATGHGELPRAGSSAQPWLSKNLTTKFSIFLFFSCKIFHILFWQCFLTILSHNVFSKTFPFLFSSFYIN